MLPWILIFSLTLGQLIKIPMGAGGITILDLNLALFCLIGIYQSKFHFKKTNLVFKTAGIFIAVCIISLLVSPIKLSQLEFIISFSYILRLFFYFLFGFLVYLSFLPSIKKNIDKIFIYCGLGLSILGLLQLLALPDLRFLALQGWDPHYFRTVSTFLDPNFLGGFLTLTLLSLLNQKNTTRFTIVIFVVVFFALLTTFSRGAYLTFGISFLTLSILKKSVNLAGITILLCLILLAGFSLYSKYIATPKNIDRAQSATYRIDAWQQGLKLFLDHPILGVGFNTYRYALKEDNLANEQFLNSRGASSNDSSLLHVASTTGIIGLISFLFFLGSIFLTKNKNYILIAGLLGLITQSFFANTLFYPFLLIWIILMITKSHF